MFKKIVVGYDGSAQSEDALALAGRLASSTGASLLAVFIYHQEPVFESQDRGYRRALRDEVVATLKPASELLPDEVKVETGAFASTTAARGLHEIAEEARADLIVIGSTHRGPAGRVLIGSVGEVLCSGSACAVTVAPRGYRDGTAEQLETVAVAFDGSPESAIAVKGAHGLAATIDARLQAISVVEPAPKLRPRGARANTHRRDALTARFAELVEAIGARVKVEHLVRSGNPIDELVDASSMTDLLVMGSRGYGPLRHVLLGGVSGRLMQLAACPLVVVPRDAVVPDAAPDRETAHSA